MPILTPAVYEDVMSTFRAAFRQEYQNAPDEAFMVLATRATATGSTEKQRGLGAAPSMTVWSGDRTVSGLQAKSFDVPIIAYAATIAVHQDAVEDDQLGLIRTRIADLAAQAKNYLVPELQKLVRDAASTLCYDGQYLTDTDHKEGKSGTQSNKLTGTGTDLDDIQTDLTSVYLAMAGWKNDQGDYMPGYVPDTVVVPADGTLVNRFLTIMQSKQALDSPDLSGWVKRLLINPYLTDTNDWYAFCTSRPVKALQALERKAATAVSPPYKSGAHFDQGIMEFGVEARGAVAPGDWRCVVQTTNTGGTG